MLQMQPVQVCGLKEKDRYIPSMQPEQMCELEAKSVQRCDDVKSGAARADIRFESKH